jgi:hypothetical protein
VNGEVGGKETGGIHVNVEGKSIETKFHQVAIENNLVSHVGGVGISNQSSYGNILSDEYYPWTAYAVRGNRVEYTGRNGIIVRYSIGSIVEYNTAAYNSRYDVGHSIFNFNTIDCTVQYNEAYGNTSDDPGEVDRGGFDCDYNSRNTIYQYNYSHDNHWFIAIQERSLNHNVIIRYNISENERLGAYMYGFPEYDDLRGLEIYNNTHYFGKGTGTRMFMEIGKQRIPTQTTFTNNIFLFEDPAAWVFDPDSTCILSNNLFYNVSPKGENAITEDPLFVNPGHGGTDIDMTDPNRLAGYKLKPGSPALNSGKKIQHSGGTNFGGDVNMDIAGNPVPSGSAPDLGAFERQEDKLTVTIVVKDDEGNYAEGAVVEPAGYEAVTMGPTGMVTFSALESSGILPVIISHSGFPVQQAGIDPNIQDTLVIRLTSGQYSLGVKIRDQSGVALNNVRIALPGIDTLYSNNSGEVTFENITASEDIYFSAAKEGYRDEYVLKPFQVNETFEVTLKERWAGLHIVNMEGENVAGAIVSAPNHAEEVSDEEGMVRFSKLSAGDTLRYTISKPGHMPFEGQQIVFEQSVVNTIQLAPVTLVFYIVNETLEPLQGASVLFMDQLVFADENGTLRFSYVPLNDSLAFAVYHGGYITYRDVAYISASGTTIFVKMVMPSLVNVLFLVNDYNNNPLEGAAVSLTGYGSMQTDTEGKALFTGVESAEDIVFQVSCEGYVDTTGKLTVANEDVELAISLFPESSNSLQERLSGTFLQILPNPARNHAIIRVYPVSGEIHLTDLSGRTICQVQISQSVNHIEFGALGTGMYLLQHRSESGHMIQVQSLCIAD